MVASHQGLTRKLTVVFVLISLIVWLWGGVAAIAYAAEGQTAEERLAGTLRIGFTSGNLKNPFFVEFLVHVESMCDALGIELSLYDGNNDVARQISIIQQWTAQAYDAIICSPIDPATLQAAVDECMQAGIPFINMDSECVYKTTFIGPDQYAFGYTAGKIAADWINQNLADKQTVECVILTKPQSLAVIERANGIINGLLENCEQADIVSILRYTDRASAQSEVAQMLKEFPNALCIIGVADVSVLGAYDALTEEQRGNPEMCLVGLDATAEVLERIAAGTAIRGTVSQDLLVYAQTCVQAALDAIQGNPRDKIFIDIAPVTSANVHDFIQ